MKSKFTKRWRLPHASGIGAGSQIRSYILDKSFIKDERTGYRTKNVQGVLDGDLNELVKQSIRNDTSS